MQVDTQHENYNKTHPYWVRMRDAIAGEDAIKDRNTDYLPMPPGLGDGIQSKEYYNYKSRARYPEQVAPAVEGMVGLMSRKMKDPELPEGLKYLEEEATPDGLPLRDLQSRVWHEVCTVGRYILFVDVPEDGGNPYIATYTAENVINWRGDADRITMVVLYEEVEEPEPNDPFVINKVSQWRVASVEEDENGNERYVVRVYRKQFDSEANQEDFYVHNEAFPTRQGETLDSVPCVFIGSRDLLPDPDAIPLLGVANKSLHYYRQYADYAMQLFMAANGTTPWGTGIEEGEAPATIGPTTFWYATHENAKFGFAEISGTGLEAQKEELENIKAEIAYSTVRVLGDKRQAETAETTRLRFLSQTATLSSIALTSNAGIKQALRFCADWVNANSEEVQTDDRAEFISEEVDPQVLTALYDGIERGLLPEELLVEYTRRVEMHDWSPEEYRKWAAGMAAEGTGEE